MLLYVGAQLERPPGPKYVKALSFAELVVRGPRPKPGTLARWRGSMPEGFACSLVAPSMAVSGEKGPLRFDEDLEEGLSWLISAGESLEARFVVVPTPATLTPTAKNRERLAEYFERFAASESKGGPEPVWAPSGLWEPQELDDLADELGVVIAFDPFETTPPAGPVAYARPRAQGARRRFSEGMWYEVLVELQASGVEEAFVAIEAERSFQDATTFQKLARGE